MSEETLQNDEPIEDIQDAVENPLEGSDLAPENSDGTEVQVEAVQIDEEVRQAKTQAHINKQYGVTKQLERELEAERAKTAHFENQRFQAERANALNVQQMPDEYDEDYDVKMSNWHDAVNRKAAFEAEQNVINQQAQYQQQQAYDQQQQQNTEKQVSFRAAATSQGINKEELDGAINTILNYGGLGYNANAIMSDPDGSLIFKHLAANPQEIAQIQQMDGYTLANHINNSVRAKATALKPKTSSAPRPSTDVQGAGADPEGGKYQYSGGATFE